MKIRKAKPDDLDLILTVYSLARELHTSVTEKLESYFLPT